MWAGKVYVPISTELPVCFDWKVFRKLPGRGQAALSNSALELAVEYFILICEYCS